MSLKSDKLEILLSVNYWAKVSDNNGQVDTFILNFEKVRKKVKDQESIQSSTTPDPVYQ